MIKMRHRHHKIKVRQEKRIEKDQRKDEHDFNFLLNLRGL